MKYFNNGIDNLHCSNMDIIQGITRWLQPSNKVVNQNFLYELIHSSLNATSRYCSDSVGTYISYKANT